MHSKTKIIGLSLVACLGLATSAAAGIIVTQPQAAPSPATPGFGGWNLSNVQVLITDTDYNPIAKDYNTTDGSYTPMVLGDSFESKIYDTNISTGIVLVNLHGKDWPVGEPSGIKVLNSAEKDDTLSHNKPASCILTTSYLEDAYLDSGAPVYTACDSPFQSHKRFKLNMLPTMVSTVDGDGYGQGVDLVFNVGIEGGTRRYQVLQKINNYTGKRLDGYKVEVGFGVGLAFEKVSDANISLVGKLKLSLGIGEDVKNEGEPADIWDADEMATFSHGLFGPQTFEEPDPHFPTNGFFDSRPAGYFVTMLDDNSDGNFTNDYNDTIHSTGAMPSNYTEAPPGAIGQFGDWLPSVWEPVGIFYDDDNNPATDADLQAFWGYNPTSTKYEWMQGNEAEPAFAPANDAQLLKWATTPGYSAGAIEDVLNLGLNYIVAVDDITDFPDFLGANATFTIRITPHVAVDQTAPGYIAFPPPEMDYNSSTGIIAVAPEPYFPLDSALTIRVSDADLNEDPGAVETIDINVTNDQGQNVSVTLTEMEVDKSFFEGTVETTTIDGGETLYAVQGTLVTATYVDANSSDGVDVSRIVTTTAGDAPAPLPPYVDNDSSEGIFSTMDNVSLFAMIFGFLAIGGIIARRQIAK